MDSTAYHYQSYHKMSKTVLMEASARGDTHLTRVLLNQSEMNNIKGDNSRPDTTNQSLKDGVQNDNAHPNATNKSLKDGVQNDNSHPNTKNKSKINDIQGDNSHPNTTNQSLKDDVQNDNSHPNTTNQSQMNDVQDENFYYDTANQSQKIDVQNGNYDPNTTSQSQMSDLQNDNSQPDTTNKSEMNDTQDYNSHPNTTNQSQMHDIQDHNSQPDTTNQSEMNDIQDDNFYPGTTNRSDGLVKCATFDDKDANGDTALHMATAEENLSVVQALCKAGANPNVRNNRGRTALMIASETGRYDIVEYLINRDNVDCNITDNDGRTALMCAVRMGRTETVNSLLEKEGLMLNVRDNSHTTALMLAIRYEHATIVRMLLNKKELEVNFEEIAGTFTTSKFSKYLPLLFEKLMATNEVETNFIPICLKSELSDQEIIDMTNELPYNQRCALWQIKYRQNNTLLHLAVKHKRHELVRYLAGKPIKLQRNKSGHTALHVAVTHGDLETLNVFCQCFEDTVPINERTRDGETAMHLAVKRGSRSKTMIRKLVESGGDLVARDLEGNTPMHSLLVLLDLRKLKDPDQRKRDFREVWDTVVAVSVIWWCNSVLHTLIPDPESESYQDMCRDALYCIRSEVTNNEGLSVLEYAAKLEFPELVHIMFTQKHVFLLHLTTHEEETVPPEELNDGCLKRVLQGCSQFLFRPRCNGKVSPEPLEEVQSGPPRGSRYKIDVSNLMPEFSCDVQGKSTHTGRKKFQSLRSILENRKQDKRIQNTHSWNTVGRRSKSFLHTLATIKPPSKVSEVLGTFPMDLLARHQWRFYQIFILVTFFLHTIMMALYTFDSQNSFRNSDNQPTRNGTCADSSHSSKIYPNRLSLDVILMLYAFGVGVMRLVLFGYTATRKRAQNQTSADADKIALEWEETLTQYIAARGTFLNFITYMTAVLSEFFTEIIHFVFCVSSLLSVFAGWFEFGSQYYAQAKGMTMLSGWIIIPILFKTYSPIYTFVVILKYILIKCVVPYLLFYTFLGVGFGSAVQLQFQLLSDTGAKSLVEDGDVELECAESIPNHLKRVTYVIWQLCIMTVGMDSKLKDLQNIGNVFYRENYSNLYVEILLFMYGVLSVTLLLNMLIAAMNTTYSDVMVKQAKGWRQYQVKQAIRIRRTTCNILDGSIQRQSRAWQDQDKQTNRWYLLVPDSNLKEIRAKYWKDTNSAQSPEQENPNNESLVNKQFSFTAWPMGYQTAQFQAGKQYQTRKPFSLTPTA